MGSKLSFDGVEAPVQVEKPEFKRVLKGAQKLTITNVEDGQSASGTPFMNITFLSERFDASFSHKFFLSPKALPRVQSLMLGNGLEKLTGEVDTSAIAALLVGRTSNYIVDEQVVDKIVGDKVYKNSYADLRFADFANYTTPFKDEDARSIDKSTKAGSVTNSILDTVSVEDDLPF